MRPQKTTEWCSLEKLPPAKRASAIFLRRQPRLSIPKLLKNATYQHHRLIGFLRRVSVKREETGLLRRNWPPKKVSLLRVACLIFTYFFRVTCQSHEGYFERYKQSTATLLQAVCVTRFDQSERVICVSIFALGKSRFEKCTR